MASLPHQPRNTIAPSSVPTLPSSPQASSISRPPAPPRAQRPSTTSSIMATRQNPPPPSLSQRTSAQEPSPATAELSSSQDSRPPPPKHPSKNVDGKRKCKDESRKLRPSTTRRKPPQNAGYSTSNPSSKTPPQPPPPQRQALKFSPIPSIENPSQVPITPFHSIIYVMPSPHHVVYPRGNGSIRLRSSLVRMKCIMPFEGNG
jgi:hypothetical protein